MNTGVTLTNRDCGEISMTLAGFTLPELSAYDPPVAGEGSIDPMGLAASQIAWQTVSCPACGRGCSGSAS